MQYLTFNISNEQHLKPKVEDKSIMRRKLKNIKKP